MSYTDVFMFKMNRNSTGAKFTSSKCYLPTNKVAMFQRQVKETFIFYSYVEWNTVQIWDVKLSINNFNNWFRCEELDIHNLIAWQNKNKILLRF